MVFNNTTIQLFLIIVAVWNVILSYFLFRTIRHYNRLTGGSGKTALSQVLDDLLNSRTVQAKAQDKLEKGLKKLESDSYFHIQRIGIVRFNPFSDTGGSQSFTLAFLDGNENGLVMTSLYARTGNRWYVKEIRTGKGKELELSKEEQAAIKRARLLT